MTGGRRTSFGGQVLEAVVPALKLRNFQMCSWKEYNSSKNDLFGNGALRLLIEHYPYTTIYGTPGRREYFISSVEWSGQLECKYQNVSGSTDEKLPYLLETLRATDVSGLVVIFAGRFYSKTQRGRGAVDWLKKQAVLLPEEKELHVFTISEFINWAKAVWSA